MLKEQIDQFSAEFTASVPAEALQQMQEASAQLKQSDFLSRAIKEGAVLPNADLLTAENQPISLEDALGGDAAIITFYRGSWCPFCNLELKAYEKLLHEAENAGVRLIAISPEQPDVTIDKMEVSKMPFKVLSDANNELAKALGLTFELPLNIHELYLGFGIDVIASQGNDSRVLPVPATYVVDCHGVIAKAWLDTDYSVRAEPSEVIAAFKAVNDSCDKCCGE